MKKSVSKIVLILCLAVFLVMSLALTACNNDEKDGEQPAVAVKKIYLSSRGQTLKDGLNVALTVITDPEGEAWDINISDPTLVAYDEVGKFLYLIGRVTENTEVTVTVSLVKDTTVTASKTFAVLASSVEQGDFVTVSADKYTVGVGIPAILTVATSNDEDYTVTVSNPTLLAYGNGVLTVVNEPKEDTQVNVTVALKRDPTVKTVKVFTVKAKEVVSTLKLKSDVSEIADVNEGEEKNKATLTVELSIPDVEYVLTTNSDKIRINDDNTVEIVGEVNYDTRVSVTAYLKDKPEVTSTISLILRAVQKAGQVNGANGLALTTDMLNALTNPSITATGTVVDYVTSYEDPSMSYANSYDTCVVMEDGKWKGTWKVTGKADGTAMTDMYVKGSQQVTYAYDKETGSFYTGTEMLKIYIDKDNRLATKRVTTSYSIPVSWENQHLYNPLAHFATNVQKKFEYREDFDLESVGYNATEYAAFKYKIDANDVDDWYYATYLSYAFTPMVSDTIDNIYIIVGANGIVGFVGETEHIFYGMTDDEGNPVEDAKATAESYTILNIKFSAVGTTVVTDPEIYKGMIDNPSTKSERENNEAMEALQTMISNMHGATNYTFSASDTTTFSPSLNESDYQVSGGGSTTGSTGSTRPSSTHPYAKKSTFDGTVGTVGMITEDAILLGTTGKYDYGMAGDPLYYTDYSGYKQTAPGSYDSFVFSSEEDAFVGNKRYGGTVTNIIPKFVFSADIFKYKSGQTVNKSDGTQVFVYQLALRDASIAKDVAMEISMYKYAKNAVCDVGSEFSIWVDEYGNLVKSVYQYSFVGGTYRGYVTTIYSDIGTTTIPNVAFEGYVPRTPETSWASFTDESFYKKHTTLCSEYGCKTTAPYDHSAHHGTVDEVLAYIFPETYSAVPTPDVFTSVFGDNLHSPGFKWRTIDGANGAADTYKEYMEFTLSYDESDENGKIKQEDYERLMTELTAVLSTKGYEISPTNSNIEKNMLIGGNRYATYINAEAGIQIVVENNQTRYFWVYVYHTGDWTLKR